MNKISIKIKLLVYFIILTFFSCQSNKKPNNSLTFDDSPVTKSRVYNNNDSSYLKIIGDSVELPPFTIDLELSKKAEDTLKSQNESVKVIAFFTGIPTKATREEKNTGGDRFLCKKEIEFFEARTAEFKNIKFSRKLYNSLANKEINLLVNVVNGRRSSNINILDCDDLSIKMSEAKNSRFTIKGQLN